MARPLRAVLTLALVLPLLAVGDVAGADDAGDRWAVDNHARRQALRHRAWPTDGVPGSVLVTAATEASASAIARREGGDVIGSRHVLVRVEPGSEAAAAGRIAGRAGVLGVEPDRVRHLGAVPDDAQFSAQWAHRLVDTDDAWDETTGSASVTVAVLDTGVDARHPDLADNVVEQADVSSGTVEVWSSRRDNDACDVGHGTMVAGVVGASGNNRVGVAGVAWDVSIVDVALTSRASRCGILDSAIIAGLEHVSDRDDPVDIVNLSLGALADFCPTALQAALDDARERGVLVVAAAGNEQQLFDAPVAVPASCDGVVSVGAVDERGSAAPYSNANIHVDVAAPGGDTSTGAGILSTAPRGGYVEVQGTSFASPYVAGIAALLRSLEPALTPDELESILERSASDRGPVGRDHAYGWGLVNTRAALALASGGDVPAPADDPGLAVRQLASSVERVSARGSVTTAVRQAVAVSSFTFAPEQALHAVIARDDDFADALAGSALGFGLGPVLFSGATGPLASATADELVRAVQPGSTVYLLGGTAALPGSLEAEVRDLGFEPVRLAGATRMHTAVVIAEALERYLRDNDFVTPPHAVVATAFNWPDAVSAGSLGAWFGTPILVTPPDRLDPAIARFLSGSSFERVYVVGGTAAISDDVERAIREATGLASRDVVRLAGGDRSGTSVAVSTEHERLFSDQFEQAFGEPAVPSIVVAVNLRRRDGFAHVLSGSMLVGAFGGVFAPVEGDGGSSMTAAAQQYVCRFPAVGLLAGGTDVITDATASLFDELLQGSADACHSR